MASETTETLVKITLTGTQVATIGWDDHGHPDFITRGRNRYEFNLTMAEVRDMRSTADCHACIAAEWSERMAGRKLLQKIDRAIEKAQRIAAAKEMVREYL